MGCGKDSHYWQDVGVAGEKHRSRELEALPFLKAIAPSLTFIENIEYGWDYLIEPEKEGQHLIYDCKAFFGGHKLERIKIAICQNITQDRYLTADEQYLQGRQQVFDKLAKMDALLVFYFPDEPDHSRQIAMAYCRELAKHAREMEDRFHNRQYSIPKEIRPILIIADQERMKEMLYRNLAKRIFEKRYVL